jgi:predicted ribosome quality control (RQC) complex YloA/Tae2 family protein
MGISPFLAQELATRALNNGASTVDAGMRSVWKSIFGLADNLGNQAIVIKDDRGRLAGAYPIPLLHLAATLQQPVPELNSGLDECYTAILGRARYEAIQGELRAKLDHEIKRLARQQAAAAKALQESGRAEEYKQMGELLLANLWQISPGVTAVNVQDYYDPELRERMIPLNVKLSVQENVDSYFHRYRKARDAREKEQARGAQAEAQLAACRAAQAELARLATIEAVQSLRAELLRKGLLIQRDDHRDKDGNLESEFQGHKIRRFPTAEGFEILVGESATANDYLTTRIAAPNDLWLHVRAAASSHVVIRTHGQPQAVPRSVLERAAVLCAQHSVQKHSSLVSVDYTLKKYVRKPRGAAPGAADYQKEITIDVTPT